MSKEKEAKIQIVNELKDHLEKSVAVVLTDYRGLKVAEMTQLRRKLREAGAHYKVVKNTLMRRAAEELGLQELNPYLEGPTAIAYSFQDPVSPAKILTEFARNNKNLELKAGVLEGKVIDLKGLQSLAELPSREELLAKVLGGMRAPLYNLVGILAALPRNLVYVLDAIRKQKEAA
ncbi:MAG: large subunit ribosomal protein [Clostridia bacterium]|nr:large subunit ribosomal protein [Clostridia bacterium]